MTLSVRTNNDGTYAIRFAFTSLAEREQLFTKLPGLVNETANKGGQFPRFKIKTAIWNNLPGCVINCEDRGGDDSYYEIQQDHILSVLMALYASYHGANGDINIDISEEDFGPDVVVSVVNRIIRAMKEYEAPKAKEPTYTLVIEL